MIKSIILSILAIAASNIYTYKARSVSGQEIDFVAYQGKKILIVNIATSSPLVTQLEDLERLYESHKDRLEIIGFPSNSFGNEKRTNAEIDAFCRSRYNITFALSEKRDIVGDSSQPIYKWLAEKKANGITSFIVKRDFQKILIDERGYIKAVFAASVNPLSEEMLKQIDDTQ